MANSADMGSQRLGALAWALAAILLWSPMAAIIGVALRHTSAVSLLFWSYLFALPIVWLVHLRSKRPLSEALSIAPPVLAIGLLGIFVWPAGLMIGLERAPAVEANLINYLWPVLIVALAPVAKERFSPRYAAAVAVSVAGVALLVTEGKSIEIGERAATGYAAAFAAAVGWALYSVLSKRYRPWTHDRIPVFVFWSALLAAGLAAASGNLEPPSAGVIAAAAALGIGPLAVAFICWDRAMSGDSVARLGVFSYIDPLASTLILALAIDASLGTVELGGLALITAGIAVAEWPTMVSLFTKASAAGLLDRLLGR